MPIEVEMTVVPEKSRRYFVYWVEVNGQKIKARRSNRGDYVAAIGTEWSFNSKSGYSFYSFFGRMDLLHNYLRNKIDPQYLSKVIVAKVKTK